MWEFLTWLASDDAPPFRLRQVRRHQKKLRTGAHTANQFIVTLTDVQSKQVTTADITERINTLKVNGFPNYFGPQRFGRHGQNLTDAIQWITADGPIRQLPRDKRSLYLSAIRSAAFNLVLAARVQGLNWNKVRTGELCQLNGSNSVFVMAAADNASTQERVAQMDVHPTAPLIGAGQSLSEHEAFSSDTNVLATFPHYETVLKGLTTVRVEASQRATRARCDDLTWQWLDEHTMQICVTLAPGVFATTLLGELFQEQV